MLALSIQLVALRFVLHWAWSQRFASNIMVYVPAEPLAHNQTQTVFTTDRGTYTADGLYLDGTYLLNVDGKDVLVVWQAIDGENE